MKHNMYIKYSLYHQWAVYETKFDSVIASFNTEGEAIKYLVCMGGL